MKDRHTRSRVESQPDPARRGVALSAVLDRMFPRSGASEGSSATPTERRVSAPQGARSVSLQPGSWNAESRTIGVVWTTGARGARFDFDSFGLVDEELACDARNVRLDRLNRGAPVLNSHQTGDLGSQIGIVVPGSARMVAGQGIATLQLSARDDVAPIVNDIAAGIIRNLSVGYSVHAFEVDRKAVPRPLYRAVDWEPTEISFVAVPFDSAAQVRDLPTTTGTPCLIRNITPREKNAMSWITNFLRTRDATPPAIVATSTAQGGSRELSYESPASIQWIREYTRGLSEMQNLPQDLCSDLALEMIERQLSEGEARDAVMQILADRQRHETRGLRAQSSPEVSRHSRAANALVYGEQTFDNPAFRSRAVEDALFARISGTAPTEQAREFMGMSMVQIAGDMLSRQGVRDVHRMNPNDLLSAAA